MASTDWDISGIGGATVVLYDSTYWLQLSGYKVAVYNGDASLTDSEIIMNVKPYIAHSSSQYTKGGALLRGDSTGANGYYIYVSTNKNANIRYISLCKVVSDVVTVLSSTESVYNWNDATLMRFRIDGYELTVEEWNGASYDLTMSFQDSNELFASGYTGIKSTSADTGYRTLFDNVDIGEKD